MWKRYRRNISQAAVSVRASKALLVVENIGSELQPRDVRCSELFFVRFYGCCGGWFQLTCSFSFPILIARYKHTRQPVTVHVNTRYLLVTVVVPFKPPQNDGHLPPFLSVGKTHWRYVRYYGQEKTYAGLVRRVQRICRVYGLVLFYFILVCRRLFYVRLIY